MILAEKENLKAETAVEVLRLADVLKPALLECWRNGAPRRVEFAA